MFIESVKRRLGIGWSLVSETIDQYNRVRADLMAAALAFYTLLSIAPLILIAVALAGFVLGNEAARAEISRLLGESMGPSAGETVNSWVDGASQSGGVASVIGVLLVLYAATRLLNQLRDALNQVWGVDDVEAAGFKSSVKDYLKRRLFALLLVVASGPILLAIFGSRAVLIGLHEVLFAATPLAGLVVELTQLVFSLVLVALMTAVVFRVVPDARLPWRSIWVGACSTSILFNVGNVLVGLYLARAGVAATYGAAGSLVVVLIWLNFSASIFLFGAELAQMHSRLPRATRGASPPPGARRR